MPPPPRVSVIMSSYNHAPYVRAAIESVLCQTYEDFESLIADDGSTDGTPGVISKINDPRIDFLPHQFNRGAAPVTNELINRCSGEYIALINSDDTWVDNKLAIQVEFLKQNKNIGAVFSRAAFIDTGGQPIHPETIPFGGVFEQDNRSRSAWLRRFVQESNCLCHPSVLIRRDMYAELGTYDGRLRQLPDFELWIRLVKRHEIHVLKDRLICFRLLHGDNVSSDSRENTQRIKSEIFLIAKHLLDDVDATLLRQAFADQLIQSELRTAAHLEIEKALLLLNPSCAFASMYNLVGMEMLFNLLADPAAATILKIEYGIDEREFHRRAASVRTFELSPVPKPAIDNLHSLQLIGILWRRVTTKLLRNGR
jgi:glycosyltransferase involved in cell wall biosynthesis